MRRRAIRWLADARLVYARSPDVQGRFWVWSFLPGLVGGAYSQDGASLSRQKR